MQTTCEQPIDISVRLNLKHGPNTEQVSKTVSQSPDGQQSVEFDMAYVPFNDTRVEQVWFDVFFDDPSMNQITIHDLTLSRRKRAEL